ncbi:hypothetical protein DYB37_009311 [Aphanomyces astaci]|uniref:DNA polymerase epsilon catalytic subunit n=1 Tax=Aphanomyces astaci TaxID=112090 RepID=A0A3R6Y4L4_APHAT|nr:hypothetical protein DYB37_009311 [Aphanomyces astaci]
MMLDTLYARLLQKYQHVWWGPADLDASRAATYTLVDGFKPVLVPGAYTHNMVIDLSLDGLAIQALLSDDGQAASEENVAFRLVRQLATQLFNDVVSTKSPVADALLQHFYRWMASPGAHFYDPNLHNLMQNCMHQLLKQVLAQMKRLGATIVYADVYRLNNVEMALTEYCQKLISTQFTDKFLRLVPDILSHAHTFPTLAGSHLPWTHAALELVKCFVNPSKSFVLPDIICTQCNLCRHVDLCREPGLMDDLSALDDRDEVVQSWQCPRCTHLYDLDMLEHRLVHVVHTQHSLPYQLRELVCKRCNLPNESQLNTLCGCTGVLQSFAFAYLMVNVAIIAGLACKSSGYLQRAVEGAVMLVVVATNLGIAFGLPVPGCPTGYLNQGGTPASVYETTGSWDPEGALNWLMVSFMAYIGYVLGGWFLNEPGWVRKTGLLLGSGAAMGLTGLVLCGFRINGGFIPINKNLWSLSFVLVVSGLACAVLAATFLLVDKFGIWGGTPLKQNGMNAIALYIGHEMLMNHAPFSWDRDTSSHVENTLSNLGGAVW